MKAEKKAEKEAKKAAKAAKRALKEEDEDGTTECLSVFCLSVCVFLCLGVRMSGCPYVCLPVCVSVRLSGLFVYVCVSSYQCLQVTHIHPRWR